MVYVGIAWAIVLIKISLPALEINFSFHLMTLLVIRSYNSLKVFTFDFPCAFGRPRYFSQSFIILAPNICWMFYFTSSLVFLLKNKAVFCLFITWPDPASYWPRISIRHWHSSTDASQNRKLSSTNNRWDIHTPFGQDNTPRISLFSIALIIFPEKPSTHNKNRYGDRGSPYFIPRDGWTKPLGSPFIKIEYDAVHTVSIAKFTHLPSNPNFSIICLRKLHSILSYALLMSSFTAIWPFFPLLLLRILCNTSKAIVVLSMIRLPGTKAL